MAVRSVARGDDAGRTRGRGSRLPDGGLRPACRATGALLFLIGASYGAAAQVAPELPSQIQPGRDRPLPQPPPLPEFDFRIESPRRSPVPRAIDEVAFELKGINVVGATAFPPEAFQPITAPLIGTSVRLSDIIALADKIEAKYHGAGYVLTRAFVPPQSVGNGVFQINVVEGYVKAISIEGGDESSRPRIESLLAPVRNVRPLDVALMERALLTANELPGIGASGLLRPSSSEPGASDLIVTVTEQPIVATLSLDNRGSIFTNPLTVTGDASFHSPLGDGGQFFVTASGSPEFVQRRSIQGRYLLPVGNDGATASMGTTVSYGQPGASLASTNILTNSYAFGPRASYPLIVSRSNRLSIDGGLTWQSADVSALGAPLNHDEWRVADLAVSYQQNGFLGGSSSLTGGIARGFTVFGATRDGDPNLSRAGARTDFTKLSMSLRRTQPLVEDLSVSVSGSGQYAFDTLVNGETANYGGSNIGRGYDPGVLAADNGVGASFELRYDQQYTGLPLEAAQFYVFYDIARAWNHAGSFQAGLASTGGGVRVVISRTLNGGIEYARTLEPLAANDNGRLGARLLFNGSIRF